MGSLSSPNTLAQVMGFKKKLAAEYLQNESSYTLHRNHRVCGCQYRKTKILFPWQILLADLLTLDEIQRRHNEPYKYILLAFYVFSINACAIPLRSKRGDEVAKALESILEQDCYKKIQMDRGSEFVNPHVKKVLLKYDTMFYHSHSPIKAALAEQLISTIRLLVSRYCTFKNGFIPAKTAGFIHNLAKIMLIYNQSPHRSLFNSVPMEVEVHQGDDNTPDTFLKQYSNEVRREVKKRNSLLVILFESIELVMFLKRGTTYGPLNFLKCPECCALNL